MQHPRRDEDTGKLDNKNTLKKTKFDLRIIHAYLAKVKEQRELLKIPVDELDTHLANFICSHRKQDGSEYEPGTLRGILGSLDRHFEKSNYPFAIYRSRETKFQKTVKTMKEKQSYLKTIGKGNHPNQAEPLTEREIELLYSTGTIGLHNPTALLHMLFFNIGLHFSLRTMEQHSLKWGDITLKADPRGRKYLEHIKKLTPGRNLGKLHPSQTMRMQIYESPEQPERDVVRAYEKYVVERPEKMKHKDSPFYLTPQPDCRPGYARWFKNLPMGETRIRSIMKNLKVAAGLSPDKKITNHSPMKTFSIRGNPGTLRIKTQRDDLATNGACKVSETALACGGRKLIKAGVSSYCADAVSDTKVQYSDGSSTNRASNEHTTNRNRLLPSRISSIQPDFKLADHKGKKIKEEWDREPKHAPKTRNKGFFTGQVSVTFHDVAACFSAEEWGLLEEWQKELYKNVMRDIHEALQAMGYAIMNSDVLLKIKEDDEAGKSPEKVKSEMDSARATNISPDILLRIKQDDIPDWRDLEVPEKEELDTSNSSIPVFDPDLSLWIFREEPDLSTPDVTEDQVLPRDTEAGTQELQSIPSPFKEPMSDTSTMYNPPYSEGPRPGKRKRRPPQRRSCEHRRDLDDEDQMECQEDYKHRLQCRNQTLESQTEWTAPEKLYQCDLCDQSFSDRSIQFRNCQNGHLLSCPQCEGTLSLHPLFNRPSCTEIETSFAHTVRFNDHSGDSVLSQPMQGPVG
ncbi:uncharacterized protein LOC134586414 [Pelobates fuscus]|uniref:uncharacterized protein LOC134586414 n=1 Tax=Pelobates fuscus TaxID=191477 RepID=UPI002FE44C7E